MQAAFLSIFLTRRYINHVAKVTQYILIIAGLLMVLGPMLHYCRWKVRAIHAQQTWLEHIKNKKNQQATLETPAAWLEIPEIDLNTIVLDRVSEENLLLYPCLEGTGAGFGQSGIKVILGHRDIHFRGLKDIKSGLAINIQLNDKTWHTYQVKETEILDSHQVVKRIQDKKGSGEDWVVLVTCYPFKYTGPAPQRFLVWARRSSMPPAALRGVAF